MLSLSFHFTFTITHSHCIYLITLAALYMMALAGLRTDWLFLHALSDHGTLRFCTFMIRIQQLIFGRLNGCQANEGFYPCNRIQGLCSLCESQKLGCSWCLRSHCLCCTPFCCKQRAVSWLLCGCQGNRFAFSGVVVESHGCFQKFSVSGLGQHFAPSS